MAIDILIFDVGRVLFDWSPRFLYEKLIDNPDRLNGFLAHVVTDDWHFQHDAGHPFAETSAALIARYPGEAALIRQFAPRFNETIPHMMPGMEAVMARLIAAKVPLYGLTNFSAEFWGPFRAREAALFDAFRDIIVSGVEKLMKPDPAIFQLAIERFGFDPQRCLFIDDRQDNCDAARATGFHAHHFTGAEKLLPRLEAEGLLERTAPLPAD